MAAFRRKPLPSSYILKKMAMRYRAARSKQGVVISHARALELVAKWHGYRDWNTVSAILNNTSPPDQYESGAKVEGRYLDRPFTGRILTSTPLDAVKIRLSLELDSPIDVVASEHFSAFRKRITGVVGSDGRSEEVLSNGAPQLVLNEVN